MGISEPQISTTGVLGEMHDWPFLLWRQEGLQERRQEEQGKVLKLLGLFSSPARQCAQLHCTGGSTFPRDDCFPLSTSFSVPHTIVDSQHLLVMIRVESMLPGDA